MLAMMLWRQGISFGINRYEARELFLLGMLMAGSSALLYFAYNYMDAGIASTILFVYPILTAVMMAVKYGERMHWLVGMCLMMASLGIYILPHHTFFGTDRDSHQPYRFHRDSHSGCHRTRHSCHSGHHRILGTYHDAERMRHSADSDIGIDSGGQRQD